MLFKNGSSTLFGYISSKFSLKIIYIIRNYVFTFFGEKYKFWVC